MNKSLKWRYFTVQSSTILELYFPGIHIPLGVDVAVLLKYPELPFFLKFFDRT